MSSSNPENSIGKKAATDEDSYAYLHVRVDSDLKQDLADLAVKENTSLTAIVTSLLEDFLYKQDDEDEEEDEDELLDLIVTSLMNLERRMEIRLATLQDTFNSLIGRLIDSQTTMKAFTPSQLRKKKRGEPVDEDDDGQVDLSDVLNVDKEEEIYKRVRRYLQQQGKVVPTSSVIQHIEVDRTLKEYLDEQERQTVGLKSALITDAIQEAAYELGFPMIDSI